MLERGNNHFSLFSDVTRLTVYYKRSQTVTNKIRKVLECANRHGNGGRIERARYELLPETRERRSEAGSRITATRLCDANDCVMTAWRNESYSPFLPLLPYSGASAIRTIVRRMNAFVLSRTCAIASTVNLNFSILEDWLFRYVFTLRAFEEEEDGNEAPVARVNARC